MYKSFLSNLLPDTLLFKRFKLIRCLSRGQYAGVYLCLDSKFQNKKTVIKLVSRKPDAWGEEVTKFINEVELSHKVHHENVLSSKKFYMDDEFVAYTMDYIEGGTLAELINAKTKFTSDEIVRTLLQLSKGVSAIHKMGIVHRDLKPENILVDLSGKLKIADFGIAAKMSDPNNSISDDIVGSINYLSPEYIEVGACDQRSDIYSIGVIAYQIITGVLPFEAETMIETLTIRVLHDPIPPLKRRGDIPESLNRLVLKALHRIPAKRFQSADEMISALQAIKDGMLNSTVSHPVFGLFQYPESTKNGHKREII